MRALALRSGTACLVLGLALGVAGASRAGDAPEGGEPERRGALTSGESFFVEWWPDPDPIPLNELFTVHFRVLEPGDRSPIAGAKVTASAWMPEHNHGTSLAPEIESHPDGTATGRGFLLHMEGHWQLRVGVAAGGRMERATFDIHLEP